MRVKIFVLIIACITGGIGFCVYKIAFFAGEELETFLPGGTGDRREPLGAATLRQVFSGNLFLACDDAKQLTDLLTSDNFELLKFIRDTNATENPGVRTADKKLEYDLMFERFKILETEKIAGKYLSLEDVDIFKENTQP